MKKIFIIGNWKSNKTEAEAMSWFKHLTSKIYNLPIENKEIIVCPPFTLLSDLRSYILDQRLPVKLGAQDISPFEGGPYTGEISARQVKEFADYVIIGHSERRKNFHEDEENIQKKLAMAIKFKLTPILCISDLKQLTNYTLHPIPYTLIVAYEPLFAIGSGNPDTPENTESMANKIKEIIGDVPVLYGGSVTSINVQGFTSQPNVSGALVGGASLDTNEFSKIIQHA